MTEATLKGELCTLIRAHLRGSVVFRHEDLFTAGIPDVSVTWKTTTWLEAKLGPRIRSRGVQEERMREIERQGRGRALYVVWVDDGPRTRTILTLPSGFSRKLELINPLVVVPGLDHLSVIRWLRTQHST